VDIGFFEIFSTALAAIYSAVRDYGLAIIVLTIAVRLILLPLTIKQTKSMREMQRIQPEVKRLQQKHKGDRQKMNTELMALYKEHGVNPFGGCAPLLLQFPVLIALYWVIRQPLEYMQHISDWVLPQRLGIGFINETTSAEVIQRVVDVYGWFGSPFRLDCSASLARSGAVPDWIRSFEPSSAALDVASCGSGVAAVIPHLLLIGVMGFTTYYQQRQMQAAQGAAGPQAQQMQMLTRIMPIFLMVIGYSFPAGLVLYWTITNVWTIGQQRLMLKGFPPVLPGSGHEEPAPQSKPSAGKATKAGAKATGAKATGAKPKAAPAKGRSGADGHRAPATSSPARRKRKR
jgi:YidC/Oxa1 family membrane protein insertase